MLLLTVFITTMASGDAFKFLALGDWGVGRPEQQQVADAMATWANSNQINFIVSTADNFYTLNDYPPIDDTNHPFFKDRWLDVYNQTSLKNLTWYISLGNNDYCAYDLDSRHGNCEWVFVEYGRQEPRWVLPYLWYAFYVDTPAGKIHIIVLDTEDWQFNKNNATQQYNWAVNELRNSRGDHKIVVGHHPLYSAGRYGPDFHLIYGLEELLNEYNVSLYLAGHDHNLQHLQYLNGTGPEIVVTGGGGRRLYDRDTSVEELTAKGVRLRHFERDFGFTEIDIQASQMKISHINRQGRVVYTYTRPLTSK